MDTFPILFPEFGFGTANSIGFDNQLSFRRWLNRQHTNDPDTLQNGIRSAQPAPLVKTFLALSRPGFPATAGTQATIGTQGAEFDVSTVNYNDVIISFDMFPPARAKQRCACSTHQHWVTTLTANTLSYAANPTFI